MDSYINILTLNVGMNQNLAPLVTLINLNQVDIVLLQEIRSSKDYLDSLLGSLGFQTEVNVDIDSSRPGTAIAWKSNLPVDEVFTIVPCRAQLLKMGIHVVMNIYAPSGSNKRQDRSVFFSQEVFRAFNLFPYSSYVLAGDFNCVLSAQDVENGTGFNAKNCAALKDLVFVYSLIDAFRSCFPMKEEFTFFRPGKAASRLDRFYVPLSSLSNISVYHVASLSDHFAAILKIKMQLNLHNTGSPRRQTYWKLNASILNDNDFLPAFKQFWIHTKNAQENFSDLADWWDIHAKPAIKQFCIEFSRHRKSVRRDTARFLLSLLKIAVLEKNWSEVARIKEKIKLMAMEDAMGFLVRSRYKQNAEEENASMFHAAREIKNDKNNINELKINGIKVDDHGILEQTVKNYFGALFNGHHNSKLEDTGSPFIPDDSHLADFLTGIGTLSEEESKAMETPIEMEELDFIIKKCKRNKSPGLDGLPYEFFKETWTVISEDFRDILQCQLDRAKLIESDKLGATRLISKVKGVPQVDE